MELGLTVEKDDEILTKCGPLWEWIPFLSGYIQNRKEHIEEDGRGQNEVFQRAETPSAP
jgi:hypothetical protein